MTEYTKAPWPEEPETRDELCQVMITRSDYAHARRCVNALCSIKSPENWVAEMVALLERIHEAAPLVDLGEDVVTGLAERVVANQKAADFVERLEAALRIGTVGIEYQPAAGIFVVDDMEAADTLTDLLGGEE